MQAQFHTTDLVDKKVLAQLTIRSNHPASSRFAIQYFLFILASVGLVVTWDGRFWISLVFYVLYACIVCAMFACEHETIHKTAFASNRLNRLVAFFAGIAYLYPSSMFKDFHFEHHSYTHIPGKDPEISLGNRPVPSIISLLPSYLAWLSGLPLFLFKVMLLVTGALGSPTIIRKHVFPFIKRRNIKKIFIESWVVLLIYSVIGYLAIFIDAAFYSLFIGQLVGHSLLAYYLAMEHNGLPHDGDILEKTRSIRAPRWLKWWMWNMPYHAEHHAYPAVPFYQLPALNKQLKPALVNDKDSHLDFHTKVVTRKLK